MSLSGCFNFICLDGKDVITVMFADIQAAHWKDGKLNIVLRSQKATITTPISLEDAQGFYDAWNHEIRLARALAGADRPLVLNMEIVDVKLA